MAENGNSLNLKHLAGLAAMTAGALLVHGYHPYAEDAEIYLPGILKILNPRLYPLNSQFFGEHAGHTLYPNLIAFSVRASHLPLNWVAFGWQLLSIFLLLAAAWRLASAFFTEDRSRWGAVALMGALLTLPVAGTALYILDQYLNPRNLAAFAAVFAVAEVLHRKHLWAALWLIFAAAVHPLMAAFAIAFCIWLGLLRAYRPSVFGFESRLGFAALLPFGLTLDPPPSAYHEVALRQPYFYIQRWEWYEWLGIIGPVVLFWWLARVGRKRDNENLELAGRAMVPFIVGGLAGAIVLGIPARFEALARIEPLRCLALAYMVLIVIGGGFLAELVLKGHTWRWLVLFLPLCFGMHVAQHQLFSASAHVEWPWAKPRNLWAQAFEWIRDNTPVEALFALDPNHMSLPGEDENGFRARAERSMLADLVKDKGAASMFPPLAVPWLEQVDDAKNFRQFGKEDFERLRQKYGVSWVVVQQPGPAGMNCPYENSAVRVCRVD